MNKKHLSTLKPGDSHMESLIEAAIQGNTDTRDAMRWLVRQLVPATQPAEVTDDLVEKARVETFQKTGADLIPEVAATFARAILALRPVQVPMTDDERKLAAIDWSPCVRAAFNAGVKAAERHHGITAQAKKETP